ncbi:MAG: DUF1700 domain-containing protein [Clostridia bacterium]
MNRHEFLSVLERNLKVHGSEKREILADYEEHFQMGLSEGRTEKEICDALGDPSKIARAYTASMLVKKAQKNPSAKSIFKAIVAALSLGFFNLVVGLPVFIMLMTILVVLFSVSAAIFITGIVAVIGGFVAPFTGASGFMFLVGFFGGVGLMAVGSLLLIGSAFLTKIMFSGLLKYLKANINIIKEG